MKKTLLLLGLAVAFTACDTGADGELEEMGDEAAAETEAAAEQVQTALNEWDVDADGVITESEWESWWDEANPFDEWDANADGEIAEDEFDVDLGIDFAELDEDADGVVTEEEVDRGLFDYYDANDDMELSANEWDSVHVTLREEGSRPTSG